MLKENNIRNLLKIHGGKRYMMKHIVPVLPKNYTSMDVWDLFGGGATCLLRSPQAISEHYNDIDYGLYAILKSIIEFPQEFINQIMPIEYKEEVFNFYKEYSPNDLLSFAIKEVVLRRMSRGGMGKAFSSSIRLRGGKPGDENAWNTWKQALPSIAERLNKVKVHNENGINILRANTDNPEMFIYADPPYYPETRVSKKVYNHEMSKEDHIEFLETILNFKGKAIVMGYDSALYRKMLKRWKLRTIPIVNHSSQTKIKETKVECLWLNYKN